MAEWTRQELEERFPFGSVNTQVDDEVGEMSAEEWNAWIEQSVGVEKPFEDLTGGE